MGRIACTEPQRLYKSALYLFTIQMHTYADYVSFLLQLTGKIAVNAVKSYRGSRDIAPFVLHLCGSWRRAVSVTPRLLYPGKESMVPIE